MRVKGSGSRVHLGAHVGVDDEGGLGRVDILVQLRILEAPRSVEC